MLPEAEAFSHIEAKLRRAASDLLELAMSPTDPDKAEQAIDLAARIENIADEISSNDMLLSIMTTTISYM
jgi:hypothetical protein